MSFRLPRTLPGLAIAFSAIGLGLGFIAHFLVTPKYVSSAVLAVQGAAGDLDSAAWSKRIRKQKDEITSQLSLAALIADPRFRFYGNAGASLATAAVVEKLRRNLDIETSSYGTVRIIFTYRDRLKAQAFVQAIVSRFIERNATRHPTSDPLRRPRGTRQAERIAQLEARIADLEKQYGMAPAPSSPPANTTDETQLTVIDPPSLPVFPIYPDPLAFSAIGCGAGFVSGIAIAILRRRNGSAPLVTQTA